MANILTHNPLIVTEIGIICSKPIVIDFIYYVPTTAAHTITLESWDETKPILDLQRIASSITATKTLTPTAADLITAGATGDIFHITTSGGVAANLGRRLIEALVTVNDGVTIVEDNYTDEGPFDYSFKIYNPYIIAKVTAGATVIPMSFPMHGAAGLSLPNLVCTQISSGTAYIYCRDVAFSTII